MHMSNASIATKSPSVANASVIVSALPYSRGMPNPNDSKCKFWDPTGMGYSLGLEVGLGPGLGLELWIGLGWVMLGWAMLGYVRLG